MKHLKLFYLIALVCFLVTACSSDDTSDDDGGQQSNCGSIADQTAEGNFRSEDFTVQGGAYTYQFEEYYCQIFIFEQTGGSCFFPEFEEGNKKILFRLPNLDPQTVNFSDVSGSQTLNFNSVVGTTTEVELATCGKLEILSSTDTTVSGRVIAEGQYGSEINGNFTLTLCEN